MNNMLLVRPTGRPPMADAGDAGATAEAEASPGIAAGSLNGTLALVLAIGLAGELIVPWTVILLSNWLVFDVPSWAFWAAFGGPVALALITGAIALIWRMRLSASRRDDLPQVVTGIISHRSYRPCLGWCGG